MLCESVLVEWNCLNSNQPLLIHSFEWKKSLLLWCLYYNLGQCQVVGVTGLILTKLDGSARGGCVVCSTDLFRIFYISFVPDSLIWKCKTPFSHIWDLTGQRGGWAWNPSEVCWSWRRCRRPPTIWCRGICECNIPLKGSLNSVPNFYVNCDK